MGHANRILCALVPTAVVLVLLACAAPPQPVTPSPANTPLRSAPTLTVPDENARLPEATEPALSAEERKLIWEEIVRAEDRACQEAERRVPYPYHAHLEVGSSHRLFEAVKLMPEMHSGDPLALMWLERVQSIPEGATILILDVSGDRDQPWYHVQVEGSGQGWINSRGLYSSFEQENEQLRLEQVELKDMLIQRYKDELAQRHGMTLEQLHEIAREGILKGWWTRDRV